MGARGVTGASLAEAIGISTTSVSKILKGHSKPRQTTLTRIMQTLCKTKEEEDTIRKAYYGLEHTIPEESMLETQENAQVEHERVERYMEARTQAMAFKNAVARELENAQLEYVRDHCSGIYSTDFLIEHKGQRIALETRFNVHRDFERSLAMAKLIKANLDCSKVFIAVPYVDGSPLTGPLNELEGPRILQPKDIAAEISK